MKQLFLKQNHTDRLNLIFLGYGQDGEIFESLASSDSSDIAIVYDYENEFFNPSLYDGYSSFNLITWSMGVMIAPKVLKRYNLLDKVSSSIAINGTIEGIDDSLGIPPVMWDATIEGICESAVLKFYRRMCFDKDLYNEYLKQKPQRTVESLKNELIFIREFSLNKIVENFSYEKAFVGTKDKIIAPLNQINSWKIHNTAVEEIDCSHYNLTLFAQNLI